MDHGCLWCKIAPKDLLPPTSRPSLITSQRLFVTFFFFQQSILPSSKAWNAHRDRNLGIFLITQVITITAEDSLRGPNIPQWNRQENSAYLLYIWRLHHIGLGYHHWNASTFSSHGMPKREMFKTRVVSWFCWRLVAENHWDYLYNLKIQVCFHYKEFCIIQL